MQRNRGRARWVGSGTSLASQVAALFAAGEQGFDISDIRPETVWQDSAKTVPGAIGQPVGYILDKSGRGNHRVQTTTTARTILQQDSGGRCYLQFDGVDDGFGGAISGWSNSMLVASAIQPATTAAHVLWFLSTTNLVYFGASIGGSGSPPSANVGTPGTFVDGVQVSPDTRAALNTALGSGVTHVEDSYPLAMSAFTDLTLGNYVGFPFGGRFYGAIATVYSNPATAALIRRRLAQVSGAVLP